MRNIKFTTFEHFNRNKQEFFSALTAGLSLNNLVSDAYLENDENNTHFRKGQSDEYKDFFASKFIQNMNDELPTDIRQFFDWD